MPRKSQYTPEEAKERAEEQKKDWKKKNNFTTINIGLTQEDKAVYQAYAQYKGLPIARLMRACVDKCMQLDGWNYNPVEDQPGEEIQSNE